MMKSSKDLHAATCIKMEQVNFDHIFMFRALG